MLVPFAAGGTTDLLGRILADRLGQRLGGKFIVENRPGAGGNTGVAAVARAPADGYTVLTADNGTMVFNPALYKSLTYNVKDLAPVTLMGRFPMILVVGPASTATSASTHQSGGRPNRVTAREMGVMMIATAGADSLTRTDDLPLTRRLLYQLSYAGVVGHSSRAGRDWHGDAVQRRLAQSTGLARNSCRRWRTWSGVTPSASSKAIDGSTTLSAGCTWVGKPFSARVA